MGCGASAEHQTPPAAAASGAYHASSPFCKQSAHGDVPDAVYDHRPTSEAHKALKEVVGSESVMSFISDGHSTAEPGAFTRTLRITGIVVSARVKYGIDGDADQFEPLPEKPEQLRTSVAKVRLWLDNQELLMAMSHSKKCATCQSLGR